MLQFIDTAPVKHRDAHVQTGKNLRTYLHSFKSYRYVRITYWMTLVGEPNYKYGQQEQVTVRDHNKSTALERSILKYKSYTI